jgi:hypothetical protein
VSIFSLRKQFLTRPHLWLIAVIGVIVPQRLRADWRQEREAELRHRERLLAERDRLDRRNKLELLRRSASAFWKDVLAALRPLGSYATLPDLKLDLRVLGFTAAVTILTGILFGLAPALRAIKMNLTQSRAARMKSACE